MQLCAPQKTSVRACIATEMVFPSAGTSFSQTMSIQTEKWNTGRYKAVGMKITGAHHRTVFSIWRLPMDCIPRPTDAVRLDICCIRLSEGVVGLDEYCMFWSLFKSWYSSIAPSSVEYVPVTLDIYCNWQTQARSHIGSVTNDLNLKRYLDSSSYCKMY